MAQPVAADPHPQRHFRGRLAFRPRGRWCPTTEARPRCSTRPKLAPPAPSYGSPFCIYAWYTQNVDGSFTYGVDYPTTADDFGKVNQFPQQPKCGGPFGPDSTYYARVIVP